MTKQCKHYWRPFQSLGIQENWMLCSNCGIVQKIRFPKGENK